MSECLRSSTRAREEAFFFRNVYIHLPVYLESQLRKT